MIVIMAEEFDEDVGESGKPEHLQFGRQAAQLKFTGRSLDDIMDTLAASGGGEDETCKHGRPLHQDCFICDEASPSPQGNDIEGLIKRLRRRRGILGALEGDLDMMEEAADALAHLSAGGKTPLSNIMGSLWRSAEDEVVELAKVLQTIATEPVNWNTTDHHYYAGIVGRFQLAADAALKASGPPTPSGEEQKEDSFAKAREHFQELLDDQTFVAPHPEQEGECNHYFAQDGICIYCHAPLAASGGGEEPINLAGDEFDTLAGNLLADMEVESHLPGHVAANAQDTLAKVLRCLISKRHAIGLLRAKQPSPAPATDGLIKRLRREGMLKTFKCADLCIEAADALAAQQREIVHLDGQIKTLLSELAAAEKLNAELRDTLRKVRTAIINSATDTVWVNQIETAVDCIDAALLEAKP